jgi:hypothetical protein
MRTSITLTTKELKDLIGEQARLDIEGIAVEKVAEEIARKLVDHDKKGFASTVETMVRQELGKSTPLGLPKPSEVAKKLAKAAVTEAWNDIVREKGTQLATEIENRCMSRLQERADRIMDTKRQELQELVNTARAGLIGDVKNFARAEFVAVLKEVKGTL